MEKTWLNSYDKGVPENITPSTINIWEAFQETTNKYPEHTAIEFLDEKYSYKELEAKIYNFIKCIDSLNIRPNEHIALILPNCPEYVIAYYASLAKACSLVQISPFYTEDEIEKIIVDSDVHTVICLDLLSTKIATLKKQGHIKEVILVSLKAHVSWFKAVFYQLKLWTDTSLLHEDYLNEIYQFDHMMEDCSSSEVLREHRALPHSTAVLQYTGGTTGHPKGAVLSHQNILSNVEMLHCWLGDCPENETTLAVLPFFHCYGMTVCMNFTLLGGGKLVICPKFDIKQVLEYLQAGEISFFPCIPAILNALAQDLVKKKLNIPTKNLKIFSGAAPLSEEVRLIFEREAGAHIVEGFGLSECSPVSHCNPLGKAAKHKSIGTPLPSTVAKIVDTDTGQELAPYEIGELLIKGPQVMQGYHSHKDVENPIEDGWLHTGDLAYIDDDGYFFIAGRQKNMVIYNGLKIYPRQVEDVLSEIEGIKEIAVSGLPDKKTGEIPAAWIACSKDDFEKIVNECRLVAQEKLASYKRPKQYFHLNALPKSALGKVLYRELKPE